MKIYISFLAIGLISLGYIFPQNQVEDLFGTYRHIKRPESPVSTHAVVKQLILKEDSSFYFSNRIETFKRFSTGRWYVKENQLFFISDILNTDSIDIFVEESYNPNLENIKVNLKGRDQKELLLAYTSFNNDNNLQYASIGSYDTCTFNLKDEIHLNSLKVYHDNGISKEYTIKNPRANQFDILFPVPADLSNYEIIYNEKVKAFGVYLEFRGEKYYIIDANPSPKD